MAQALITADKQPEEEKELSIEEKLQSTEYRFAEAYIASNFNLAEAARRVFKVGSKGAKKGNMASSASQMGRTMLNKVDTQKYLRELILNQPGISPVAIVNSFAKILSNPMRDPKVVVDLGTRLLEEAGIMNAKGTVVEDHRHIHLNLPPRKDD